MAIISAKTMKIIDERKKCDTMCVGMRWSNSKL